MLSERSINYRPRSIYDTETRHGGAVPRGTMCSATQTILMGIRRGKSESLFPLFKTLMVEKFTSGGIGGGTLYFHIFRLGLQTDPASIDKAKS